MCTCKRVVTMICIQFVTFSSLRSLRNCFIFSRVRWLHRLFVMLTYLTKCIYQEKKKNVSFVCTQH